MRGHLRKLDMEQARVDNRPKMGLPQKQILAASCKTRAPTLKKSPTHYNSHCIEQKGPEDETDLCKHGLRVAPFEVTSLGPESARRSALHTGIKFVSQVPAWCIQTERGGALPQGRPGRYHHAAAS